METLKINGTEKYFPAGERPETLADLLTHMDIHQATIVVEINGKIIERKNFAETTLTPSQSIELIRFVGGG